MKRDEEIIDGITRAEAENDRSNWEAKERPPLGKIKKFITVQDKIDHGVCFVGFFMSISLLCYNGNWYQGLGIFCIAYISKFFLNKWIAWR